MRRLIARAVAALVVVAGLVVGTTVPADATPPAKLKTQQVQARDWWF